MDSPEDDPAKLTFEESTSNDTYSRNVNSTNINRTKYSSSVNSTNNNRTIYSQLNRPSPPDNPITVDNTNKSNQYAEIQHFTLEESVRSPEAVAKRKMSFISKLKSLSVETQNDEILLFPGYAPVIFKYFSQKSLPRYWFLKIITQPW